MKYVAWIELYSNEPLAGMVCFMSFEEIAKVRRHLEPRYTSDDQAVEDFIAIHWGSVIEIKDEDDKNINAMVNSWLSDLQKNLRKATA